MAELIKSKYREAFEHIVNCDREDNHASNLSDAYRNDLSALLELINRYEEQPAVTEAEIRAKAIDEFAAALKWEFENSIGVSKRAVYFANAVVDQAAERLKGGNDHEQDYQGNT